MTALLGEEPPDPGPAKRRIVADAITVAPYRRMSKGIARRATRRAAA